MRLLAAALALALLARPVHAQAPAAGAITIGTVDSLRSTVMGETRKVLIYTPPSYKDTTYTPRRYPVLYLLDGDAHFHSVTGLIQILATGVNGTFVIPEMIVVAIPNTNRMRDLSPTKATTGPDGKPMPGTSASGGGPAFLSFIQRELIPHVDSAYRTSGYRVFVGHSLGGITVVNALYTMPETFNAYLAIDPSLWWDSNLLLKQARAKVSATNAYAGRALYVAQANTINPGDTTVNQHFNAIAQFDGVLRAYNQSRLRYGFKYYPDDSHGSVPMIAEYDGLRFLFQGYALDLLQALDRPAYVSEHFAQVSRTLGTRFDVPEGMVDLLGQVAGQQEKGKGLAFFKLNTELYPNSAHAYQSLALSYRVNGDTARAIGAYERALALAPGRTYLKTQLESLKRKRAN